MGRVDAPPSGLRPRLWPGERVVVGNAARALVPGLVDLLKSHVSDVVVIDDDIALPTMVVRQDGTDRLMMGVDDAPSRALSLAVGLDALAIRTECGAGQTLSMGSHVFVAAHLHAHVTSGDVAGALRGGALRQVSSLPPLPSDAELSIDAYLLALDDERVVVPEIDESAFEVVKLAHEVALGRLVQTFLDMRAAELDAMGLVVVRLPAMPPIYLQRTTTRAEGWTGTFLTPTQALVAVVEEKRLVVLPRFQSEPFPLLYRGVFGRHLARWTTFFESEGYVVKTIDAELLVQKFRPLNRLAVVVPRSV
jgi:hypothetical protein